MVAMRVTIQLRRGTAAEWATANTVLAGGEPGWDETNDVVKIGNGVDHWADLEPILNREQVEALIAALSATDAQVANAVAEGTLTPAAINDVIDARVPAASTTASGKVELATNTEAAAGADTVRAVTAAGLRYALGNGQIKDDLTATIGETKAWAKNPDLLVVGALTYSSGLLTTAAVVWPDGATGTLTITSRSAANDVTGYTITRVVTGQPTKTYTQPTITRDSSGNATNVPQITVA